MEEATADDPFDWPLAFERLVVTTADFQRLEVAWRALSQSSDTLLTLVSLIHVYEAAFVSWGRHAASIAEPTRVSVFLQALSQGNKDYLGMPGSPLREGDPNATFQAWCAWLRTFDLFGPPDVDLLSDHTTRSPVGAVPVTAPPRGNRYFYARRGPRRWCGARPRPPSPLGGRQAVGLVRFVSSALCSMPPTWARRFLL